MRRRIRFKDPEPLPPDATKFVDEFSANEYAQVQQRAVSRMVAFDSEPKELRTVESAVGYPDLARRLLSRGIRTVAEAEAEQRRIQVRTPEEETFAPMPMGAPKRRSRLRRE